MSCDHDFSCSDTITMTVIFNDCCSWAKQTKFTRVADRITITNLPPSSSPSAHHGEIVEGGIVDVVVDIVAVKTGVVHHSLQQKSSVAFTAVGTRLIKVTTYMMRILG